MTSAADRDPTSVESGGPAGVAATGPSRRWIWFALNATVFAAAACVMIVEILSTRLVARYLGSSLYTWTSAIGVVLAGISIGNYVGGRLADRYHPRRTLSLLFVVSSIACATIPLVNNWMGRWTMLEGLAWPTRVFLHFTFSFLIPATTLGTMSPVVARMALDLGQGPGRTIGTIYAWGAAGSILGTFVAGYFLVAAVGTERSVLLIAGVLALIGIVYGYRSWIPYGWSAMYAVATVCVIGPWSWTHSVAAALGQRDIEGELVVFDEESHYQKVVVLRAGATGRTMVLDALVHSKVNLADPLELKYEYEAIYAEVLRRCRPPGESTSALFIGGGGYVFPRYMEIVYPGSYLEVSEIDPVVTRAAFETFGLPRDTSIRCFDLDARNRVADLLRRRREGDPVPPFEFVFGDAFNDFTVPFHLTTLEFNRQLAELMTPDGVYMLNLVDALDSGRFLGAVLNTCRAVFPHVYAIATQGLVPGRNTFVVVSARRPLDLPQILASITERRAVSARLLGPTNLARLDEITAGMVLTDDDAPVENLLAPVVRAFKKRRNVNQPYLAEITVLFQQGEYARVIERCRAVLASTPDAPRVHYWLGFTLAREGRYAEAIEEFRAELRVDPSDASLHVLIGSARDELGDAEGSVAAFRRGLELDPLDVEARFRLGESLGKLGRTAEAEATYREVLRQRPGYVKAHVTLGRLLFDRGEYRDAAAALAAALQLDPDRPGLHRWLGLSLARGGLATEAAEHFRLAIEVDPTDGRLHNQLGRVLANAGAMDDAAGAFARAVELDPASITFRVNLALAAERGGRPAEAVRHYRVCLDLDGRHRPTLAALARLLASSPSAQVRDGAEAVRLAERLRDASARNDPEALDVLAMACAEAGSFARAVETASRAADLARAADRSPLAAAIESRLELYRAGRPYRGPF